MAPPVMAQHVEGRGWDLDMEFSPHASLGMGHVDLHVRAASSAAQCAVSWTLKRACSAQCCGVQMNYRLQVTFHDGDTYYWQKVSSPVSCLLFGRDTQPVNEAAVLTRVCP